MYFKKILNSPSWFDPVDLRKKLKCIRRYVKRTKFVRHKIFQDDQVIAGYRKKDNDIKETSMIEELRKRSFRWNHNKWYNETSYKTNEPINVKR